MSNIFKKLAAGGLLLTAALFAHAGPVITNGGFETGDFTGWTLAGDTIYSSVAPDLPNTGAFSAVFGEPFAPSTITQSLATDSGHHYLVKFWLANAGGSANNTTTVNAVEALVGGDSLIIVNDKTATDYTEFAFQFTAISALTDLTFSFRHDENFWLFDDVSISEVSSDNRLPEPGTLLLFATAFGLFGLKRKSH